MNRVLYGGLPIIYPLIFHTEVFMAPVKGISVGSLDYTLQTPINKTEIENLYKCPQSEALKSYMLMVLIIAFFLSLLGLKHEFIKAIFGPKISWIIQRTRTLLSGGLEGVSTDNSERSSRVPREPRCIHVA